MIEELQGGLRNALERGNSLEQAVQSLINAGYAPQEVQQAAQQLGTGATSHVEQAQERTKPMPTPVRNSLPASYQQSLSVQQTETKSPTPSPPTTHTRWKPILIGLSILILLLIIGLITIMLTGDMLLKWIS